MRGYPLGQTDKAGDMFVRGAATSSKYIHQTFIQKLFHFGSHFVRRLFILPQTIGKTCVGVSTDIIRSMGSQLLQIRLHLTGTKRTVQSHGKNIRVLH